MSVCVVGFGKTKLGRDVLLKRYSLLVAPVRRITLIVEQICVVFEKVNVRAVHTHTRTHHCVRFSCSQHMIAAIPGKHPRVSTFLLPQNLH